MGVPGLKWEGLGASGSWLGCEWKGGSQVGVPGHQWDLAWARVGRSWCAWARVGISRGTSGNLPGREWEGWVASGNWPPLQISIYMYVCKHVRVYIYIYHMEIPVREHAHVISCSIFCWKHPVDSETWHSLSIWCFQVPKKNDANTHRLLSPYFEIFQISRNHNFNQQKFRSSLFVF